MPLHTSPHFVRSLCLSNPHPLRPSFCVSQQHPPPPPAPPPPSIRSLTQCPSLSQQHPPPPPPPPPSIRSLTQCPSLFLAQQRRCFSSTTHRLLRPRRRFSSTGPPPICIATSTPTPILTHATTTTTTGAATMIALHRLTSSKSLIHIRLFSQSAAAALLEDAIIPTTPLTYLEGFPKPGPAEAILAIPRTDSGKSISAKERKAGRVPSIIFEQEDGQHGGNKRLISVQTNRIKNLVDKFGRSFFLSKLFDLEVRPDFGSDEIIEKVRVLPRQVHLHSGTDAPLNVTFIRAPSSALLKVDIPLVYIGDDVSPGLKKGASLNTINRTVKFLCPADIIPPYIDVDLSELDVGQKLVAGDLKVHPALKLLQSEEQAICKIMGGRVSEQKKSK